MKKLSQKGQSWAESRGIEAIYLFGSQARGKTREGSDLDVGLLLREPPADWERGEILREEAQVALADEFGVTASRLDVVLLNDAPPAFGFQVIKPRKILYDSRNGARVRWERRLLQEYLDFAHYEQLHFQAMKRRLTAGGS